MRGEFLRGKILFRLTSHLIPILRNRAGQKNAGYGDEKTGMEMFFRFFSGPALVRSQDFFQIGEKVGVGFVYALWVVDDYVF